MKCPSASGDNVYRSVRIRYKYKSERIKKVMAAEVQKHMHLAGRERVNSRALYNKRQLNEQQDKEGDPTLPTGGLPFTRDLHLFP